MHIKNKKIILSVATIFALSNNIYAKDINTLETLTVTAQKQSENIKDVPLSLSVFDEISMEDKQIDTVRDLASYTPNLMFFEHGASGMVSPSSRGIFAEMQTLTTSIGLYIDGVPVSYGFGFDEILVDIEQIEVLKGPQGTLYGKNTEAGVINVRTKKPTNQFKAKADLELATDNKKRITLNASGPLIKDTLYLGVSAKHYEKDGDLKHSITRTTVDDKEHNYGKINLRWTPKDNLELSLISSKLKYNDDDWAMNNVSATKKEVASDFEGYNKSESLMNALTINYTLDNLNIQSITTKRTYKDIGAHDFDHSPMAFMHTDKSNTFKKLSQEFKLSQQKDNYSWLIGLYGDKDDNTYNYETFSANPMFAGKTYRELKDDSLGIFAHGSYTFNDKFTLIGGVRFDKDTKTYKDNANNIDLSRDGKNISPKLALNYKLSKNAMAYINISKGYRSGGFNPFAPIGYSKTYDEETLISYELGSKSSFLDNRLTLNSAIYYMDISDMQVNTSIPNGGFASYMSNATKATSKGIEFDLNYQATKEWSLFSSMGYNNIKFGSFSDTMGDYSGNTNPYAPKYNYNLGTQYRNDLGYFARIDISGYGKMYYDKANLYEKKAYNLVNMKLGYETDSFDIYLYGKNIFDKNHDSNGYFSGKYVVYSVPREIGMQLAYRF